MNTGTLVEIAKKTQYDFSYLPASQSETIVLARAINVIPYYYGSLWVRLHTNRSTGATVKVVGLPVSPSEFDQQQFSISTASLDSGDFSSNSAPDLIADYANEELPPFLQIQLEVTQNSTPASIFFEISIDLLLRSA